MQKLPSIQPIPFPAANTPGPAASHPRRQQLTSSLLGPSLLTRKIPVRPPPPVTSGTHTSPTLPSPLNRNPKPRTTAPARPAPPATRLQSSPPDRPTAAIGSQPLPTPPCSGYARAEPPTKQSPHAHPAIHRRYEHLARRATASSRCTATALTRQPDTEPALARPPWPSSTGPQRTATPRPSRPAPQHLPQPTWRSPERLPAPKRTLRPNRPAHWTSHQTHQPLPGMPRWIPIFSTGSFPDAHPTRHAPHPNRHPPERGNPVGSIRKSAPAVDSRPCSAARSNHPLRTAPHRAGTIRLKATSASHQPAAAHRPRWSAPEHPPQRTWRPFCAPPSRILAQATALTSQLALRRSPLSKPCRHSPTASPSRSPHPTPPAPLRAVRGASGWHRPARTLSPQPEDTRPQGHSRPPVGCLRPATGTAFGPSPRATRPGRQSRTRPGCQWESGRGPFPMTGQFLA